MTHDPRIQLGKAVRKRRLSMGLSQEALAEKADLHWTYIYIGGIERGERNVSLINIVGIARLLWLERSHWSSCGSLVKRLSALRQLNKLLCDHARPYAELSAANL